MPVADTLRTRIESSLGARLSSTLLLRERQAPLTVSTGVPELDKLTGGLPRGALSEIVGPASSGRTGIMLAALAGATRRQEICALVDASDSFDPVSAERAGIDLSRLLWVRCSERSSVPHPTRESRAGYRKGDLRASANFVSDGMRDLKSPRRASFPFAGAVEQVLKVTDLLLQGGGFGMVVLDLGDIPSKSLRRVPLTSWFRFRRAVEPTATVLLLVEQEPWAKTCASLVVQLQREEICASDSAPGLEQSAASQGWQVLPNSTARKANLFREAENCGSPVAGEDQRTQLPENNVVSHAALLRGMNFRAEVVRSWMRHKPPHSAGARFGLRVAL